MIFIDRIVLHNIRSYADEDITLPIARLFFKGDNGAGKSTIIEAGIDFPLLGLGEVSKESLLKDYQSEGSVTLFFNVDNKKYIIRRKLIRKNKYDIDHKCYFDYGNGLNHLEDKEIDTKLLRKEVLKLLNFKEPSGEKKSRIFRYAIYTPQDEMLAVLYTKDKNERLDTIRRAFRIEECKAAWENATSVAETISRNYKKLGVDIKNLEDNKKILNLEVDSRDKLNQESLNLDGQIEVVDKDIIGLEDKRDKCRKDRDNVSGSKQKISDLDKRIIEKNDEIESIKKSNDKIRDDIEKIDAEIVSKGDIKIPSDKSKDDIEKDIIGLEDKRDKCRGELAIISRDINIYNNIKNKEVDVCPTCGQPIDIQEFENRIEISNKNNEKLSEDIEKIENDVKVSKNILEKFREYESIQKDRIRNKELKEKYQHNIEENNSKIENINSVIENLRSDLENAKRESEEFDRLTGSLKEIEKYISEYRDKDKQVHIKKSGINGKISEKETRVKELKNIIDGQEKIKKEYDHEIQVHTWLVNFWIPAVKEYERLKLDTIRKDFNEYFQKWFSMLIEDDSIDVYVDEDFTPKIRRNGETKDIAHVSGGQRSSMALAYRFALNYLVYRDTNSNRGLLILDEPTYGLSETKIRNIEKVIKEMGCKQVIIVSHQEELRHIADYSFMVTKKNNESHIEPTHNKRNILGIFGGIK